MAQQEGVVKTWFPAERFIGVDVHLSIFGGNLYAFWNCIASLTNLQKFPAFRYKVGGKNMFSFFRKSQDPKKPAIQDKEADGFVLLGQTTTEQRPDRPAFPGTETTYSQPLQNPPESISSFNGDAMGSPKLTGQMSEGNALMAELLNDIPFILAPHLQEVQNICSELPERVPIYNLEENVARFHYDFTLENSVLCGI